MTVMDVVRKKIGKPAESEPKARMASRNRDLIRKQSDIDRYASEIADLQKVVDAETAAQAAADQAYAAEAAGEDLGGNTTAAMDAALRSAAEAARVSRNQIAAREKTIAQAKGDAEALLADLKDIAVEVAREHAANVNARAVAVRERYRAAARDFATGIYASTVAELRAMSMFSKANNLPEPLVTFNVDVEFLSLPEPRYWTPHHEIGEDVFSKADAKRESSGALICTVKEQIATRTTEVLAQLESDLK